MYMIVVSHMCVRVHRVYRQLRCSLSAPATNAGRAPRSSRTVNAASPAPPTNRLEHQRPRRSLGNAHWRGRMSCFTAPLFRSICTSLCEISGIKCAKPRVNASHHLSPPSHLHERLRAPVILASRTNSKCLNAPAQKWVCSHNHGSFVSTVDWDWGGRGTILSVRCAASTHSSLKFSAV